MAAMAKEEIFEEVERFILDKKLDITFRDIHRPWGGFFVINEADTELFIKTFFPDYPRHSTEKNYTINKLSPKILIVAPHQRLSWQYHYRRAEIWTLLEGEAAIVISETDEENLRTVLEKGKMIKIPQGHRHRLIGLNEWGIIAEIWHHTDPAHASDEEDIVRVQDDFGR